MIAREMNLNERGHQQIYNFLPLPGKEKGRVKEEGGEGEMRG